MQIKPIVEKPAKPRAKCPDCGTTKTWKCGCYMTRKNGLPFERQQWKCRVCGKTFTTSKVRFEQKEKPQGGNICQKGSD